MDKRTTVISVAVIGFMFFIFGFVSWVNAILIPYFKISLELTNFKAYLVFCAFAIFFHVGSQIIAIDTIIGYAQSMGLTLLEAKAFPTPLGRP